MKENLFRGKPKRTEHYYFFSEIWDKNCDDDYAYGSLLIGTDNKWYICVAGVCKEVSCINNGMTSMIEVIPETVGQFTGEYDVNGNKIFEQDMVKKVVDGKEFVGKVEFADGAFGVRFADGSGQLLCFFGNRCEIVKDC